MISAYSHDAYAPAGEDVTMISTWVEVPSAIYHGLLAALGGRLSVFASATFQEGHHVYPFGYASTVWGFTGADVPLFAAETDGEVKTTIFYIACVTAEVT